LISGTHLRDRTVADAILDRLVHNSYRLILKGESMRRHKTVANKPSAPPNQKTFDPNTVSDRQFTTALHPARHHPESWSGISRNGGLP
jgi:hypothetical protein